MSRLSLTDDEKDDLLLACRYGDLEDVRAFVKQHDVSSLPRISDGNGNTILHMVCANGHVELLDYLLPLLPPSVLLAQNTSGSTPLHWAALNSHLSVAQKLVQHPGGPGIDLIDIKNKAGRSPLGEAELSGWDEGAKWFVEVMHLEPELESEAHAEGEEGGTLDAKDAIARDIEVEIEDADGQVAKMTIGGPNSDPKPSSPRVERG